MSKSDIFEVRIGEGWPLLVHLEGQRLFSFDGVTNGTGRYSDDGGRTWSGPFKLQPRDKNETGESRDVPMGDLGLRTPLGSSLQSIRRLTSGRLGGLVREPMPKLCEQFPYRYWTRMLYVTSEDDGKTWSAGVPIGPPCDSLCAINSLLELRSGRLVAPMALLISDYDHPEYAGKDKESFKGGYGNYQGRHMLVEGHRHTPEFEGTVVFYSDDQGHTWKTGPNNLWIWPLPSENNFGGHSNLDEPVAVELEDGRILMYFRTVMGRIYQSISTDGGEHWSVPEPTQLASSDSPCMVRRIPGTADLVIIWNQVHGDEILRGLKRSRMSCAISTDNGKSWKNFKTLEVFGGLPRVGRIEPPPIRTYHSYDDVGEIPVDFGCIQYPDIAFVGDMVLFGYSINEMKPMSAWSESTPIHGERDCYGKIKGFPVSWLYES